MPVSPWGPTEDVRLAAMGGGEAAVWKAAAVNHLHLKFEHALVLFPVRVVVVGNELAGPLPSVLQGMPIYGSSWNKTRRAERISAK